MARRRTHRPPPTPTQRRRMMIAGAVLVAFACFAVFYEAVLWEGGNLLALAVVALVLFIAFILPIIGSVRHARRGRA